MNRLSAGLLAVAAALTFGAAARAGSDLPEPTHSRVILHGVDCSISDGTVCDDERPVFDEAIASVPATAGVTIQIQVLDTRASEPTGALSRASADAVRDYFIGGGIAPEHVDIEECPEASGGVDWHVSVGVQFSSSCN